MACPWSCPRATASPCTTLTAPARCYTAMARWICSGTTAPPSTSQQPNGTMARLPGRPFSRRCRATACWWCATREQAAASVCGRLIGEGVGRHLVVGGQLGDLLLHELLVHDLFVAQ